MLHAISPEMKTIGLTMKREEFLAERRRKAQLDELEALHDCLDPCVTTTEEDLIKTPTWVANIIAILQRSATHVIYAQPGKGVEGVSISHGILDTRVLVTWVILLREMNKLYDKTLRHTPLPPDTDVSLITRPTIVYRRRSWDLLPPDVARSLASTNVGAIVIIATRLGMKWRTLEWSGGGIVVSAEGNGYTLTSNNVRGVGTVLSLNRLLTASTNVESQRASSIPSRYADMMLCGILPGDPSLIDHDFKLMGDNFMVQHDVLLDYLGVDQNTRPRGSESHYFNQTAQLPLRASEHRRTGFNDLILLIPPFLPCSGSTTKSEQILPQVAIQFRGFLAQNMYSVFTFIEGRMALLRGIMNLEPKPPKTLTLGCLSMTDENPKKDCEPRTLANTTLAWISLCFQAFSDHAASDFFAANSPTDSGIWSGADGIHKLGENVGKRVELVAFCRKVHRQTTIYFSRFQNPGKDDTWKLVAFTAFLRAHSKLAENVGLNLRDWLNLKRDPPVAWKGDGPFKDERVAAGKVKPGCILTTSLWPIGNDYVRSVDEGAFAKELSNAGVELDREKARIAWWMLMLRGLAWTMGVFIETELTVPSSFWGNMTPVWIT